MYTEFTITHDGKKIFICKIIPKCDSDTGFIVNSVYIVET